jgi:hypothetical protein
MSQGYSKRGARIKQARSKKPARKEQRAARKEQARSKEVKGNF